MSESANLASALAAFQAELPSVAKGSTNTHYNTKYADLADVVKVVMPALGRHGLAFTSRPTLTENGVFVLAYSLMHGATGQAIEGMYPLPASTTNPQQLGSALTYARRYALCAVTGVAADEDNDGNTAPPASDAPAERHEASWDAAEQEMLRDAWLAEIAAAADATQLREIGKSLAKAKRAGELSPASYARLAKAGAARKAELDAAGGGADVDGQ